ncbi:MAG: hypothetical protein K6C10_01395 [Prevotella sp.]|nr:hypothetical protein [Prevotella sp.]
MRVSFFFFLFLLSSCGDTQQEYTTHACYLVIDNASHNDATLGSAMTPYSNVFTTITVVSKNGARYFVFKSNQQTSSESIFNAIDAKRTLICGMNNGVIVGYGVLSDPLTFYAYDRECPNCFDLARIPIRSYPISVASNGIGTCAVCQRQYNLNSGGIIVAGDAGKKLTRYRSATTGPYGVLTVN